MKEYDGPWYPIIGYIAASIPILLFLYIGYLLDFHEYLARKMDGKKYDVEVSFSYKGEEFILEVSPTCSWKRSSGGIGGDSHFILEAEFEKYAVSGPDGDIIIVYVPDFCRYFNEKSQENSRAYIKDVEFVPNFHVWKKGEDGEYVGYWPVTLQKRKSLILLKKSIASNYGNSLISFGGSDFEYHDAIDLVYCQNGVFREPEKINGIIKISDLSIMTYADDVYLSGSGEIAILNFSGKSFATKGIMSITKEEYLDGIENVQKLARYITISQYPRFIGDGPYTEQWKPHEDEEIINGARHFIPVIEDGKATQVLSGEDGFSVYKLCAEEKEVGRREYLTGIRPNREMWSRGGVVEYPFNFSWPYGLYCDLKKGECYYKFSTNFIGSDEKREDDRIQAIEYYFRLIMDLII